MESRRPTSGKPAGDYSQTKYLGFRECGRIQEHGQHASPKVLADSEARPPCFPPTTGTIQEHVQQCSPKYWRDSGGRWPTSPKVLAGFKDFEGKRKWEFTPRRETQPAKDNPFNWVLAPRKPKCLGHVPSSCLRGCVPASHDGTARGEAASQIVKAFRYLSPQT